MRAPDILRDAAKALDERATTRDLPQGERSMARCVASFNALTGTELTETQGWMFMAVLKLARATAGTPNADDWVDLVGYAALGGESIAPPTKPGTISIINCCKHPNPQMQPGGSYYCLNCNATTKP